MSAFSISEFSPIIEFTSLELEMLVSLYIDTCGPIVEFVIITFSPIKHGSIIIDVGINKVDNKIIGDVNFEEIKDKVRAITPVPGGVGPMTIACLLSNTLKCFKAH